MCTVVISRNLVCTQDLDKVACLQLHNDLQRVTAHYVRFFADQCAVDPAPCQDAIEERLVPMEWHGQWTILNRVRQPSGQYKQVDILQNARQHRAPERALVSYVRNLCRFTVTQQARRVERRRRREWNDGDCAAPPEEPEYERREALECLLIQLPEVESRALRIYYLGPVRLTQSEAATRLGLTRDRLQTVLQHALRRCRKMAAQRGWDTP